MHCAAGAGGLTSLREDPTKYRCVATLASVRRLVVARLAFTVVVSMLAFALTATASASEVSAAQASELLDAPVRDASEHPALENPARHPSPQSEDLATVESESADDELDVARSLAWHAPRMAAAERVRLSPLVSLRSTATLERPPRA
jgi:hypothetical protein